MQKVKKSLGRRLAEEGIELALDNAGAEWCAAAHEKLRRWCARRREDFAFEDFRAWALRNGLPAPSSHKAWGGIAQGAINAGIIKPLKKYRPAVSPMTHGHPVRLYRVARSS